MKEVRVILFGTGSVSKFLREQVKIAAYLVTGASEVVNGISTITLEQLQETEYDYIVVAFGNTMKGIEILEKAGVPNDKIVGYAYTGMSYAENLLQKEFYQIWTVNC